MHTCLLYYYPNSATRMQILFHDLKLLHITIVFIPTGFKQNTFLKWFVHDFIITCIFMTYLDSKSSQFASFIKLCSCTLQLYTSFQILKQLPHKSKSNYWKPENPANGMVKWKRQILSKQEKAMLIARNERESNFLCMRFCMHMSDMCTQWRLR